MAESNILETLLKAVLSTVKKAFAGKVDRHVFPALSGPFKQAVVPVYASVSAIPTAGASVASAFNFGAWEPVAGDYVAFVFINGHLNAAKGTYDGTGTWAWGEATPLSLGCQLILEDSAEGRVYVVTREARSSVLGMDDVVKPIVGKIPLETSLSGSTVSINYLSRCDVKFKPAGISAVTLTAYSSKDCSVTIDSSGMTKDDSGQTKVNWVPNGTSMRLFKPTKIALNQLVPGTWGDVSKAKNNFEFDPFVSAAVVQQKTGVPSGDPTTQLESTWKLKDPSLVFDDGSEYRLNFHADFAGTTPELSFSMVYEEAKS